MLRGARAFNTLCRRAGATRILRRTAPSSPRPVLPHPRSFASVAQTQTATPATATASESPLPEIKAADLPIVSSDAKQVAVGWDTRTWSRFHNIWLRDHCRCSRCFHSITKQRLLNTFQIPADIAPLKVSAKPEGLEVVWNTTDSHTSLYPWSWLEVNSYDPPLTRDANKTEKVLWGSKIQQAPPTVAYEEVMAGDAGLYKWLSNIDRFGFSFVSGVPPTPEATEELSERIGFIRETQYGRFWDFTSDLAKGDTAYTTIALGAHTDNTYFLFHLLEHTGGTGGATLLVDGFYAASILKELNPEAYRLLSEVPIPAHAAGEPTSFYRPTPASGYPVLGHDNLTRDLTQVRWNNDDRSVMSHLEAGSVEKW
ncbi:hypothetical protein EST38_g4580 [Candolleomyces aberdarensis]|uniref:trimethyllysine dioxygenase n=1 Tax=Candolleomyces aberdarensis TaxID=2316362 RepID=A0A4Q2DPH4_9AGAR|nr:hypothetical protein EST38_g4580 [Candolleomyces aberdarensis]